MRYLSVCAGIEAASVAWHDMGWEPVAFSEIEPFPCAVLAHHYPNVPNWGDMTKFKEWPDESIDILVGGTPCQSFSVAGLRKGLDDPRGNLMLTYLAIADKYRPEWLVWENVPGVLSSGGGADFATFLGALGELGYGFAYRILDAQFFGVAQRRRRVFVVANSRDWRRAAAVLFERESLSGNPAPRRKKGKEASGTFTARTNISRNNPEHLVPEVVGTLSDGAHMGGGVTDKMLTQDVLSRCLMAKHMRLDSETETYVVAPSLTASNDPSRSPQSNEVTQQVAACYAAAMQVRRLTPKECERLQGFPDDYTAITYKKKPAVDGPRYKALGNSMAVPVMRWIGNRIQMLAEVIP